MIDTSHIILVALLVFAFGLVSRVLAKGIVTAPMVFGGAGLLLANGVVWLGLGPLNDLPGVESVIHILGEGTLIVLLFSDAARINMQALRREGRLPARLLGIGMPLTIVLGAIVASPLFPEFGIWELALLAAILAPTDAALGQAVVVSEKVPARIRQTLSVESGLNDGFAVPLVLVFGCLASLGHDEQPHESVGLFFALKQVMLGPVAGIVVGYVGAKLIQLSIDRKWISHDFLELSGIALALLAALGADIIGGNSFIAAFVGGLVFGNSSKRVDSSLYDFAEAEGTLLMLLTFMLAGAALAPEALHQASWQCFAYALLSLTLIRVIPVFVSLLGVRMRLSTKLFLGWFGPRGVASVLFAIVLLEELHVPHTEEIFQIAMITVALSVILHGVSAAPGATWYARLLTRRPCPTAQEQCGYVCYRTKKGAGDLPVSFENGTLHSKSDETIAGVDNGH